MQKFSAANFYDLTRFLAYTPRHFKDQLQKYGQDAKLSPSSPHDLEGPSFIAKLHRACTELDLKISLRCVQLIEDQSTRETAFVDVLETLAQLERTIAWEMEEKLFMYIPATRAERYDLAEAFGGNVAISFSSAKFDIWEAGNCFSAGRPTACVFHLMRALELGLIAFAKIFGIPTDHENWQNIIEGIEKKIREMGKGPNRQSNWKEKQELYSQIANSFMFFKDAWRNYTAHARGKYVEEEADAIYRNVRSFMKRLAENGIFE